MQKTPFIWLIDDDDSTLDIVTKAFEKEHLSCQLKAFNDTHALLTEMQQATAPPTMLLVDYGMPGTNGLQLIERLKNDPFTRELKTVLFSRNLTATILQNAENLDVYQVESKPSGFNEWRELVKELCLAGHFS